MGKRLRKGNWWKRNGSGHGYARQDEAGLGKARLFVTMQSLINFDSPPRFDGPDYVPSRDNERLAGQMLRVFSLMRDGNWRTLREIAELTGDPEASVSAQLRHLKKERFGGHGLEKEHVGNGLYLYKLVVRG